MFTFFKTSRLSQETQYVDSLLTDKIVKHKLCTRTGCEILSRLSLSYTTMASNADQWKCCQSRVSTDQRKWRQRRVSTDQRKWRQRRVSTDQRKWRQRRVSASSFQPGVECCSATNIACSRLSDGGKEENRTGGNSGGSAGVWGRRNPQFPPQSLPVRFSSYRLKA